MLGQANLQLSFADYKSSPDLLGIFYPSSYPCQKLGVSQEYIENENARLEREHQFWQREIVVKIEYKFCPNLTIIDTPGDFLITDMLQCSTSLLVPAAFKTRSKRPKPANHYPNPSRVETFARVSQLHF